MLETWFLFDPPSKFLATRLSFSKLKLILLYLRAAMTSNRSRQVVLSTFDENRKRRNSESLL